MNYLLNKRKRHTKKVIAIIALIFILIYFSGQVFRGFSKVSHAIFRPVIIVGNSVGRGFSNSAAFFKSKKGLYLANQEMHDRINEYEAELSNYNAILAENETLKDTLGRVDGSEFILGTILSKPHKSTYDTLVIDIGERDGVVAGDEVFALGNVPIGRVDQVFNKSSKVVLYSSAGEKREVIIGDKNTYLEAIGRGGGNFEINIPRDMKLPPGTEATTPGITPYTLAKVVTIISDPRDSFAKALLTSPVSIQELKFVEVKK